ncbi:PRELI/MSF1 protein [Aphelenchoides avenae]|nr:PRELI/MSF1 protein [Aphelenchus avenae]
MTWFDALTYYFSYAFNEVAAVFYDRYPNSFAKHILSEDVPSREITKDQIITRKFVVKLGAGFLKSVLRWLSCHAAVQTMPTLEESAYDRRTKTMTPYTRNVSWSHLLQMQEKCTYRPTNDHTNRTELSRRLFVMVNYGQWARRERAHDDDPQVGEVGARG